MTPFTELGKLIEQRWQARRCDTDAFSEIAQVALLDYDITRKIGHDDLIDWAMCSNLWPMQTGSRFGQPPINVHIGAKFYIEVLTWVESTTSIHQHNFSGAFQVLHGSSMHSRYHFKRDTRIDNRLLLGETRFMGAELLSRGDVRPILSGDRMIHALFHLEHPSATIVARTVDEATGPQFNYDKPCLAIDPFYAPEPFATQARLLRMLASIESPRLPQALQTVLAQSDAWSAYRFLEIANVHVKDPAARAAVIEAARARHGEVIDRLLPCLDEATRQANIITRRAQIKDIDHRFFLALLLNLPDRASILELVSQRFPQADPVAWLVDQVRQLSAADRIGLSFDDTSLSVFETLLRNQDFNEPQARLVQRHGAEQVARQGAALRGLSEEIRGAMLFQPLFA